MAPGAISLDDDGEHGAMPRSSQAAGAVAPSSPDPLKDDAPEGQPAAPSSAAANRTVGRSASTFPSSTDPLGSSLDATILTSFESIRLSPRPVLWTDPLSPSAIRRSIPGELGIVASYEPKLLELKREAQCSPEVEMDEEFDEERFHFGRVLRRGDREVLARVRLCEGGGQEEGRLHPILVNVSPLMHGHGLLVPWPELRHSQVLRDEAVGLAIEMTLLGGRDNGAPDEGARGGTMGGADGQTKDKDGDVGEDYGFRIGFNSLGAFSSVNHLHLHVLYPDRLVCPPGESFLTRLPRSDDESGGGNGDAEARTAGFPIERALIKSELGKFPVPVVHDDVGAGGEGEGVLSVDLLEWTVPCLSFSYLPPKPTPETGNADFRALRIAVSSFLDVLRSRNIPHNVLFARVRSFSPSQRGVRVIVIPRQPQHCFSSSGGYSGALGEISGLLVMRSREQLESLTEEGVRERMGKEVAIGGILVEQLAEEARRVVRMAAAMAAMVESGRCGWTRDSVA